MITDEEPPKPTFEKQPLKWEEDAQLYSQFLDRKVGSLHCLKSRRNYNCFKFELKLYMLYNIRQKEARIRNSLYILAVSVSLKLGLTV